MESDLLHPVAYGSSTRRYGLIESDKYILYPYHHNTVIPESQLREEVPRTYEYLNFYQTLLKDRSSILDSGLKWYELVRRRDEAWMNSKKLLTRDLATKPSFAVDPDGSVYLVGGAAVVPADEELLFPLLGYLNSNLMGWYLSQVAPLFKSGFQKFEPQHLQNIPVLKRVVEDDDFRYRIGDLAFLAMEAESSNNPAEQREFEEEIDSLLFGALGLDHNEII